MMMAWPRMVFGPEHAQLLHPRDRRLAVAGHHLVELDDRLRGVHLVRALAPRRRSAWRRGAAPACTCRSARATRSSARGRRGRRRGACGTRWRAGGPRAPASSSHSHSTRLPSRVSQPPGAERLAHVHAHPVVRRALDHVLAERADLHHRGDAAAQHLGHREVDAGAARLLVLGLGAHGQHLEQPRVPELRVAAVLDERPVERRAGDVGVGRDQPRRDDAVRRLDGLVHPPSNRGPT